MRAFSELLRRASRGDRVLLRADLNVPLRGGEVADDTRLRATLPTIEALRGAGLVVVLCSHLGRPEGPDPSFSLAPVARALGRALGDEVPLAAGLPAGDGAAALVASLAPGEVGLLENLRFDPREEKNDPGFADALVRGLDLFVNDAFGSSHRAHASVVGAAERLPAYPGILVEREVAALAELRDRPARPFWLLLGGAKVSDKIGVVDHLAARVDGFAVGGGMANTFLAARGVPVGGSKIEKDRLGDAKRALAGQGSRWVLPVDVIAGRALDAKSGERWVVGEDPGPQLFLDIGPSTVAAFREALAPARTIFWNGPMGVFENPAFAAGTRGLAELLGAHPGRVVIGGGDTAAAAREFGIADRLHHVCTGGGAALEYLEGKDLPGLAALERAARGKR